MVPTDGVVMGDRAAEPDDCLRRGGLDLLPLLELPARGSGCEHGVVRGRAVGIGMGEADGETALAADALERVFDALDDAGVEGGEAIPCDGGLEGLTHHPEPDEQITRVGRVEERAPPGARGAVALALFTASGTAGSRGCAAAVVARALECPGHPRTEVVIRR